MSEWNPGQYARSSQHQEQWALDTVTSARLSGDERILDVGCGDGRITKALAELTTGSVVGIDQSPEMVAHARRCHEGKSLPNLSFELGDALAYRSATSFDRIVSFSALHWVCDHRTVLNNFHRLLIPSGELLLQFGGKGNAEAIMRVAESVMAERSWRQYFIDFQFPWYFYDAEEYRIWLAEAGFRPLEVALVPKDMSHDERESLAKWMETTWFPVLDRVPPARRPGFRNEVIDAYAEHFPPDGHGVFHLGMVRLQVHAMKA